MFTQIEDCRFVVWSMLRVKSNVQNTSDILEELQHCHEHYANLIIQLDPINQPILPQTCTVECSNRVEKPDYAITKKDIEYLIEMGFYFVQCAKI